MVEIFTSTGLLGGPSLAPAPLEPQLESNFVSNGLLGTGPSPLGIPQDGQTSNSGEKSVGDAEMRSPLSFSNGATLQSDFVSNGLLGGPSSEMVPEDLVFRANGLLGSDNGPRDSAFASNTQPSQSQDDSFLNISDILGIRPNESSRSSRAPHTPITLPRAPVRATTFSGRTMYIKRKTRVLSAPNKTSNPSGMGKLLDVPIHRLMDEISATAASKLTRLAPIEPMKKSTLAPEDTLWVDRYRPRRFTELLGNERVARETMMWVKQWDWCVFGKKRSKKRQREDDENYNPDDEYHRPKEKLLLISGPPGLGKTTLAHVIAVQAGYEVMEINASDARSAQVVDDRIRPTLEAGSAVGSTKPVLLIIDEIDGATGGDNSSSFVQKLVSLTFDRPRNKRKARDQKEKRPLLRPIICICNDQNAHALAKLRPHARQIRCTRPADIHIVKRLREICDIEGLKADTRALSTLVGVAKGDMRGCLNTLQFIKSRNEDVTEPLIRRATVGMKEADTSITNVINELFAPLSRKRAKELGIGEEEESRYASRLSRAIEGLNNPSSISNGCFAHYANCCRHDANMSSHKKGTEWLATYDLFSSIMYSEGDFGLHSYLSYFLVPFHPLFKERGGQRIERDSTDWDNLQLTRSNDDIYKSLSNGVRTASGRSAGDYRHLITGQTLQLEFAPFINRIISPPLRPVNSQVIKPTERALLLRLVEIMVALELRFIQEKAEDGQLVYRLDPPIDVFVTYDGKRAADIAVSRYAVRHLVATEIDAALIARQADAVEKSKGSKQSDFFGKASRKLPEAAEDVADGHGGVEGDGELRRADRSEDVPANKRARPQAEKIDIADKPPVDFFGRLITVPNSGIGSKSGIGKKILKEYQVKYQFLEGNSAAVRKPVKVSTFL
ncbi:hypothetical protein BJ138DRAFT_925875 [Hygrophoropsis aurantiaca]|uniref:Uncharacterized protein n=1 Tax=Hygrophoropsis aurantiaca TaxID=72124 RepID=A0ACB8ADN6_9AGAM|nr:hypothetical protein BJ138DRAFT_925875 [Hygrophoropsis aurantiaca]